jgi:hypothetical protein
MKPETLETRLLNRIERKRGDVFLRADFEDLGRLRPGRPRVKKHRAPRPVTESRFDRADRCRRLVVQILRVVPAAAGRCGALVPFSGKRGYWLHHR